MKDDIKVGALQTDDDSSDDEATMEQASPKQKLALTTPDGAKGTENKDRQDDVNLLRVHVAGLPKDMDRARLKKDFAACGKIDFVNVPFDDKGRAKGFAFITFKTKDGVLDEQHPQLLLELLDTALRICMSLLGQITSLPSQLATSLLGQLTSFYAIA